MGAWTRRCLACGHGTDPRDVLFNQSAIVLCSMCRGAADRLLDDPPPALSDRDILAAVRRAWTPRGRSEGSGRRRWAAVEQRAAPEKPLAGEP